MIHPSLRNITNAPFWQSTAQAQRHEPLSRDIAVDLLVVGGGFTGLWTAIESKLADPALEVALVEADVIAGQASGRNGGFVHASLTHGFENGHARWPADYPLLHRLGDENLHAIRSFVADRNIACDWRDVGELELAARPHERLTVKQQAQDLREFNSAVQFLDTDELRQRLNSQRYIAALYDPTGVATVNPTQLANGLLKAALDLGVHVYEHTPMTSLSNEGTVAVCSTPYARIRAHRVALAINAFRSPFRIVRRRIAPVYDYSLVTQQLSAEQWADIGWHGREGAVEASNLFCYFRRTSDDRILFGGYDAVHHFNSQLSPSFETSYPAYERQVIRFFATFPQLEGVEFEYGWGGAIDTSTRFTPFWTQHFGGKVASVTGFTGLGVGSSRFAARIMLGMLMNKHTDGIDTEMVATLPHPFPPEPFKSWGINQTQHSLAKADSNGGRRDLVLRTLDRLGIGFDS